MIDRGHLWKNVLIGSLVTGILTGGSAAHAGANPAHDLLLSYPESERIKRFTVYMAQSGVPSCKVVRSFFQDKDAKDRPVWNVGCSNGKAFVVSIENDADGSTKIVDCAIFKLFNTPCFTKF